LNWDGIGINSIYTAFSMEQAAVYPYNLHKWCCCKTLICPLSSGIKGGMGFRPMDFDHKKLIIPSIDKQTDHAYNVSMSTVSLLTKWR